MKVLKNTKPISLLKFSLLMSGVCMLLYNIPFFAFATTHADMILWRRIILIAGLAVVMLALNFLICYLILFLLRHVGRVLIAITHILSAAGVYFVVAYHVMLDESMLRNVFNTRYSEASGFFSVWLWLSIIVLGLLPAIYVFARKIDYGSWKRFGASSGLSLLICLVCALANYNQLLWFGTYDTELGGLLMPWSYVVNTCRIIAQDRQRNVEEIPLADGAFTDDEPTAVVLVIGESARRANFSLYGYERETNPQLGRRDDNLYIFTAQSCATYTTGGVRSMLEAAPTRQLHEILPNYLSRMGADVSWRSNNWGEPPVHTEYLTLAELRKAFPSQDDGKESVMFAGIKERILSSKSNKVFIVVHTTTSHGPLYESRYPDEFAVYMPVASNIGNGNSDIEGIRNAYDNTILYTDYLFNNLLDTLASINGWHTAALFVSDHGESLGENGLYMHGAPMNIAPREQYEIPFIIWLDSSYRPSAITCRPTEVIDQHYVFHTVLHLMGLKSPAYVAEHDLLNDGMF